MGKHSYGKHVVSKNSHVKPQVKPQVSSKQPGQKQQSVPTKGLVSKPTSKLSELQQKFAKKLEGSRFRVINEKLYSTRGNESFEEFQKDPNLFNIYHQGFREQASHWPENPLDKIIESIVSIYPKAVVADMGCGDAKLAQSVPNKVYSFDLVAGNERIIAADIAHVPLENNTVDVVVFCLSLMGVNIVDFITEAHRILKPTGILKIAEVKSRFQRYVIPSLSPS